jgi:hypothetical protein
MVDLL